MVGQGEVGGVTRRVTCTWWLLGLAVKVPWLGPGGLRFSFGVRASTEMEIRCVEGMYRLKLVSCENNSGFKGLMVHVRAEIWGE